MPRPDTPVASALLSHLSCFLLPKHHSSARSLDNKPKPLAAPAPPSAANLLKPMLARGELRLIGATTLNEYREHVEKDAAFERRFQQVGGPFLTPAKNCFLSFPSERPHSRKNREFLLAFSWEHFLLCRLICCTCRALPRSSDEQLACPARRMHLPGICCAGMPALPSHLLPMPPTPPTGRPSPPLLPPCRYVPSQVLVGEPSVPDTVQILRGLKERYAGHHGVQIADRALVVAAELADR